MRTTSLFRYTLVLAFVVASAGLADAQAQRVSAEEAEAQGLSHFDSTAPAAPAEGGGLQVCVDDVLLIPDSSADGVDVHDPVTGDLVIDNFILDPDNLSTPKNAIGNFDGDGIFVIDQIDDAVQEYDCDGNYVGLFAPAGGVDTSILDNAIAIDYSPDGTELWVAVTGGTNADAIARFDQSGNYLGNIVANGAGGLDGPFDVLVRDSDMLVPAITSDNIHQYDLSGTFLGAWQSNAVSFPEQAQEITGGNVLVAEFSGSFGAYEYDASGTLQASYSAVTGARGIYELPNGNLLITSGSSVKEITRGDVLVRDFGSGNQYIELFSGAGSACDLKFIESDLVYDAGTRQLCAVVTVQNNGTEPARATLKLDYNLAGGPPSGTRTLGSGTLPGGTQAARTVCLTVPAAAPPGDYNFTLNLCDADGNNCGTYDETISISAPRVGPGQSGELFEVIEAADFSATAEASAPAAVAPNPFARQTTISYEVAAAADVRLAVYDVLGREVAVLVDGRVEAGTHSAVFDASDLAAGTYVYRLQVGSDVRTGRMTLAH